MPMAEIDTIDNAYASTVVRAGSGNREIAAYDSNRRKL
jgi:hypothetical protein